MTEAEPTIPTNDPRQNFEDFFENSLCGFIIANPAGIITRANNTLAQWVGCSTQDLESKKFSDLLSIGGKIYDETHLWPLLRMQGFFDEVVLELNSVTGNKIRVMANAMETRDSEDKPGFIRYTILRANDRLQFEQNLQEAKSITENELAKQTAIVALREQLIAVLGHDLRNPLSAINMAAEILSSQQGTCDPGVLATLKRSASRMTELIDNIVDFARTRLGEGIIVSKQDALLAPVLRQVVDELQLVYPHREIITVFDITEPVHCDAHRIGQLLSNLVGNALTHGAPDTPVYIDAFHKNGYLELSVSNSGAPIPEDLHEHLFTPFSRQGRPSQNGLGLGLYIAAEIARAHDAQLSFISTNQKTCFSFRINGNGPQVRGGN